MILYNVHGISCIKHYFKIHDSGKSIHWSSNFKCYCINQVWENIKQEITFLSCRHREKYICDVQMTTNRVGILNISIRIAALLFFLYFWRLLSFLKNNFTLPSLFGMKRALRSSEFDMYSHVKTLITLHSYKSDACVLYARVID